MSYFPSLMLGLAAAAVTSCAPKFTAEERSRLSTMAIAPSQIESDARKDPYGGDVQARDRAANVPAAGIAGPLIGLAVGSAIAGTQNSMFESSGSAHFPAVRKNTPADLGKMFEDELRSALKKNEFAAPRLKPQSENKVVAKVTSHRLVRISKNDEGELLLAPEIFAVIELKDGTGKKLAGGPMRGFGTELHTIKEYAAKPALVRSTYKETLQSMAGGFSMQLSTKARE